jgi:predicted nucleic acid-binding protein
MSLFVDTSAVYALLVRSERDHRPVLDAFRAAVQGTEPLWVTSYVLVETAALLQHRIGLDAVRDLERALVPLLSVEWVSRGLHRRAVARLLRDDRRRVSLVDCASFEFMKAKGLTRALTLDRHFAEAGFEVVPQSGA